MTLLLRPKGGKNEGKKIVGADRPLVIMRHDIDMDLEAALKISSLEKDLGIHSTYFFMVCCPLYNVFSSNGAEQVKEILAAGHHFGLHFDCALYQDITVDGDDITIKGKGKLRGARMDSFGDHRTCMSLVIAALCAEGESEISDIDCINTSFPDFFHTLEQISVKK